MDVLRPATLPRAIDDAQPESCMAADHPMAGSRARMIRASSARSRRVDRRRRSVVDASALDLAVRPRYPTRMPDLPERSRELPARW
jgi:hypothetical protein